MLAFRGLLHNVLDVNVHELCISKTENPHVLLYVPLHLGSYTCPTFYSEWLCAVQAFNFTIKLQQFFCVFQCYSRSVQP